MLSYKKLTNLAGWLVFAIAFAVYFMSAERTGSLWDCGEFILGAYKLQVVHPPGAAIFLIIGRLFTWVASIISDNPEDIAFSVNLMSGLCSAFAAMFVCWITIILSKLTMVNRSETPDGTQSLALAAAGIVAGLATAFCSSIWFSAVEGEVYAMSTFFTTLTLWCGVTWYNKPDNKESDRWLVMTLFMGGLSIGVHLLSILTFPALTLLYYFKKYKEHNLKGVALSLLAGVGIIVFIQKVIIVGIPKLWSSFELAMVNGLGLPFHSGLIPTTLVIVGLVAALLYYAEKHRNYNLQWLTMAAAMIITGFSTLGVVVIRANADTPVNMNTPSDAFRLIPYLNREQYGERPLLWGPHYEAKAKNVERTPRRGRVGDKYEFVDEKLDYVYNRRDLMFFPRVGHTEQGRPDLHRMMRGKPGRPGQGYNLYYMFKHQMGWMYWRYFMWNFVGRQNAEQGFFSDNKKSGHWLSGIKPIDEMRLYNMDELPESMKKHRGTNKYYFIPLILGLLGIWYHSSKKKKEFFAILTLFVITGLGIIIYSNQPPNEPRERDYVLVGSFFTFCIWIGMGVLALMNLMMERAKMAPKMATGIAFALALSAPLLMGFQNFDDHSRNGHYASRDYAANFLNSCEPNAIIFTYGDNDTYPLWYAQQVENIRTDVRVVNLSLIAVDWYIDKLRKKVDDSEALKLTVPSEAYRGNKRNQVFFYNSNPSFMNRPMDLQSALKFVGASNPLQGETTTIESYLPSRNLFIPVDRQRALNSGMISAADSNIVNRIPITFKESDTYITKDELAILDVISSNMWDRPIYFSVTCKNDKLMGLNPYMQMEGLGLRIIPVKTPVNRQYPTIYGSGRVDLDRAYNNIMTKWKWGNFDKKETFVDQSYNAEIMAMKVIMMRTGLRLLESGQNDKAVDIADKYFEAFPNFNFTYDVNVLPVISIFVDSGDYERAKKHLRILAQEARDHLEFYDSLEESVIESSFRDEYRGYLSAANQILNTTRQFEDKAFEDEMKGLLEEFRVSQSKN